MKRSLGVRKLLGFMFVSIAGTFLHFLYDITGRNIAAGLISAVNESIWEHMKLIFYPMLLVALTEYRLVKEDRARLRCSTLAGILLALMLIPVLIGVSLIVFTLMQLSPGDPAMIILGAQAAPEDIAILREEMEGAASLAVPLTVSTAIGKSWLEAEH